MCYIKFSIKKVGSDSLGLVDFAVGLVNAVFNLPNGQVKFSWGEFRLQKNWGQSSSSKIFVGVVDFGAEKYMPRRACQNGKL